MEILSPTPTISDHQTTITSVHYDIIHTHILTKLDGPTLASTASTCSHFQNLCSEKNLWKNICNNYWPSINNPHVQDIISSFPSTHKSFFSDSFPTLDHNHNPTRWPKPNKKKKIAAGVKQEFTSLVDVHLGNQLVYSKVIVTENKTAYTSSWIRIDVVDANEIVPVLRFDGNEEDTCMKILEEELKLSWIIIDPIKKRAINLSSHAPLEIRRHWMRMEHIEVIYGIVVAAGAGVEGGLARYFATLTFEDKEGGELHMTQIRMQVEDMSGKLISRKDSLVILQEAMDGKRVKREFEEEKKRHKNFLEMRGICRENKHKRERRSNMVCIATGCMAFYTVILFALIPVFGLFR